MADVTRRWYIGRESTFAPFTVFDFIGIFNTQQELPEPLNSSGAVLSEELLPPHYNDADYACPIKLVEDSYVNRTTEELNSLQLQINNDNKQNELDRILGLICRKNCRVSSLQAVGEEESVILAAQNEVNDLIALYHSTKGG